MAFQGGAPELRFGDRLCFQSVLTEGHLGASFTNGVCFPVVTIHPDGYADPGGPEAPTPSAFENCIFALKRSGADDYASPHEDAAVVTYGRWVRLVNVASQQQLSVSVQSKRYHSAGIQQVISEDGDAISLHDTTDPALSDDDDDEESGEPAVCLRPLEEGQQRLEDTFRILPRGKIREEGESVRAGEQVVLESVAVAGALLTVGGRVPCCEIFGHRLARETPERALELISEKQTASEAVWVVDSFDSERDLDSAYPPSPGTQPLSAGSAVTLLHKETDTYLEGLPLLSSDGGDEVFFQKSQPRGSGNVRDTPFTSNAVWIVESHDIVRGGLLFAGGYARDYRYRLRHLASGRYLCAAGHGALRRGAPKLKLVSSLLEPETDTELSAADASLITLYPLDEAEETISATSYARVELTAAGAWLHCTYSDQLPKRSYGDFQEYGDDSIWKRSLVVKDENIRLRAGIVTKVIYEDLFCIQSVDWQTVCAIRRAVSIVPLLKEAADRLGSSETFKHWNEIFRLQSSGRSAGNSPSPEHEDSASPGNGTGNSFQSAAPLAKQASNLRLPCSAEFGDDSSPLPSPLPSPAANAAKKKPRRALILPGAEDPPAAPTSTATPAAGGARPSASGSLGAVPKRSSLKSTAGHHLKPDMDPNSTACALLSAVNDVLSAGGGQPFSPLSPTPNGTAPAGRLKSMTPPEGQSPQVGPNGVSTAEKHEISFVGAVGLDTDEDATDGTPHGLSSLKMFSESSMNSQNASAGALQYLRLKALKEKAAADGGVQAAEVDTEEDSPGRAQSRRVFFLRKHPGKKLGLTCIGNLISHVAPGEEADQAGMKEGMRLLAIAGKVVNDDSDEVIRLFEAAPGCFDIRVALSDTSLDESEESELHLSTTVPSPPSRAVNIGFHGGTIGASKRGMRSFASDTTRFSFGSPGSRKMAALNMSFPSIGLAKRHASPSPTPGSRSRRADSPSGGGGVEKVKWNVAEANTRPVFATRSELSTMKNVPCRPNAGSGKLIQTLVKDLLRATWLVAVKQTMVDTTVALASLITFVSIGVEDNEWRRPRKPYISTRYSSARAAARAACAVHAPPNRLYQRILFDQDIHLHIIRLLKVPFVPHNKDAKQRDGEKNGGLHISEVALRKYQPLHMILRLSYKLIRQMVNGSPDMAVRLTLFSNFFWEQSGYRLNTTDTIHSIVQDNEPVLREISDSLIENIVSLVECFGRSPSYLNLLAALCVCKGKGQYRAQQLISKLIMPGSSTRKSVQWTALVKKPDEEPYQDVARRTPLLYETQLRSRDLYIQLLPSHKKSVGITPHRDPESGEWGTLKHIAPQTGSTLDKTGKGRFISLTQFVTHEDPSTVSYFERQLHLFAAMATDNEECARLVSERIPREHVLAALRSHWNEDAVRTGFLELVRVLYLDPAAKGTSVVTTPELDFIESIKELLTRDLAANTKLVIQEMQRNRLVCEMLRCCKLLIERKFFKTQELSTLVPVLCKVLDPTDDIKDVVIEVPLGGALDRQMKSRLENFPAGDPSSWAPLVRAVEGSLFEVRQRENRFEANQENRVVMECKLVTCRILEQAYALEWPVGEWANDSLSADGPIGTVLAGRRALVKILLCATIYRGNPELFHASFKLLCRCLSEDKCKGADLVRNDSFPAPNEKDAEHPAVTSFAELLTQDVQQHRGRMVPSTTELSSSINVSLTRHLISVLKDNPYHDPSSVTLLLRVLRRMIFAAKEARGEKGMIAMQNALDDIGGTDFVTTLIEAPENEEIAQQALLFGIALLEDGNVQVQERLMGYFDTLHDENFFASLRTRMQRAVTLTKDAHMREKRKALEYSGNVPLTPSMRVDPDDEQPFYLATNLWHVKDTLRLLQLFCEGHNLHLQNYIHSQPDNLHSVDLVKESILVLKAVLGLRVAQMDSYLLEIILQGFNSLTEYCQGPCKENQNAIINAHVANEVTTVLSTDYSDLTDNKISQEETDVVRNAATITLLALLEGCQDGDAPKMLLRTLDLGLIGITLDQCWINRKASAWDGVDSALELGFNLFIFMETLSAFDDQGYLQGNRFFMRDERGYSYFSAMTGRIEICRDATLERVYFRIPDICLNLSATTRRQVLWSVDRETPAARISSFFSMADDVLFEIKYSDRHFSERVLREAWETLSTSRSPKACALALFSVTKVLINRKIAKLERLVIYVALVSNCMVLLCHPYDTYARVLLSILSFGQVLLTAALVCHHAIAHGPILAHKTRNNEENDLRSRLHRHLGPEEISELRDPAAKSKPKVLGAACAVAEGVVRENRPRVSGSPLSTPVPPLSDSFDEPLFLSSPAPDRATAHSKVLSRPIMTKWHEVSDEESGVPVKRWQKLESPGLLSANGLAASTKDPSAAGSPGLRVTSSRDNILGPSAVAPSPASNASCVGGGGAANANANTSAAAAASGGTAGVPASAAQAVAGTSPGVGSLIPHVASRDKGGWSDTDSDDTTFDGTFHAATRGRKPKKGRKGSGVPKGMAKLLRRRRSNSHSLDRRVAEEPSMSMSQRPHSLRLKKNWNLRDAIAAAQPPGLHASASLESSAKFLAGNGAAGPAYSSSPGGSAGNATSPTSLAGKHLTSFCKVGTWGSFGEASRSVQPGLGFEERLAGKSRPAPSTTNSALGAVSRHASVVLLTPGQRRMNAFKDTSRQWDHLARSHQMMRQFKPVLAKPTREVEDDEDHDRVRFIFSMRCLLNEPAFLALLVMVASAVFALIVSPFFLTFHLFSIVSNSTVLQSVIRSITKNGRSLVLTGLLAVIVVYMFAVIGFLFFRENFYKPEENCSSMLRCFAHTLFNGIRAGGGIGDLMEAPSVDTNKDGMMDFVYLIRAGFDFFFFVIVVVILLNIIFGIIIDTFAELRSEKQKIEEDIKTRCFICGIEASEFERHANGFVHHIKCDHNMWLYIYFIHHLRTKESSEFTGQESNVYDKMKVHDLSFFPTNRAICLNKKASIQDPPDSPMGRSQQGKSSVRQLESIESKLVDVRNEGKSQSKRIELLERRLREMMTVMQSELVALRQMQQMQHMSQNESGAENPGGSPVLQNTRRSKKMGGTQKLGSTLHEDSPGALPLSRRARSTSMFASGKFSR